MAYNNYFPMTYPYVGFQAPQPQIPPQPQYRQQPQQPAANGIIWVQGMAGAKSYLLAPGQTAMLMDSENPVFYIKSADQSGMPTLRAFDYKEREYFNVSRAINAQIWKDCCETVSVRNTSDIPINVVNANIIISRPDLAVTR